MKLYAERPHRVLVQLVGDLLLIGWIGGWVWLSLQVHAQLDALRAPTIQVGNASRDMADSLSSTGEQLRSVQLIGDLLAAPFDAIVEGAQQLTAASDSGNQAIARLADTSIFVTAFFPIVFGLTLWIVLRGRWIRRATAAARVRASAYGDSLLAAQALSSVRIDRVAKLVNPGYPLDDPVSRRRLASYQLRQLGLRGYEKI
jgi:hypothetical protein